MWGFYATAMCLCVLFVGLLLRKFAAPKVSPVVLAITFLAWLTSMSVVALVPIDVYTTLAKRDTGPLEVLWSISYWSTQVLTWAVIPVFQGYALAGAFTVLGRLQFALRRLWVFYLIIGALALVGIGAAVAAGRLRLATLPSLVFTLSNTYGLIVIMALLGYGLVEIPRILWRRSFPEARLKWHYHRVGRAADSLTDASDELERALAIVLATSQQVPRSDVRLRERMDRCIKFADEYSPVRLEALSRAKVDIERLEEGDLDYASNVSGLARLRGRLKLAIANFQGCCGEYTNYVRKALELETVCKARQLGIYFPPPSGETGRAAAARWYYKCVLRSWVLRGAAAAAAAASAVVVWSEATIGSGRSPDLSPFSLLIHSPDLKYDEFLEQLLVAAPLAYMCGCAYFSLFKLGNFGFYHVVSGATWAYSLLLSGSLLARFAPPLCFNFLHVIRMNEYLQDGESMVFIQKMGAMNDVPVLGQDFNTWFPLVMVLYVALLSLNWWERCCSRIFVASRFRFDTERADDEHTSRGARLVQAEAEGMSKGWPLGDGIGLFGVGSSRSNGAGTSGGSSAARPGGSMEMPSTQGSMGRPPKPGSGTDAAVPAAAGSSGGAGRYSLFAGTPAGPSEPVPANGSSQAALIRQKYAAGAGSSGSLASQASGDRGAWGAGSSSSVPVAGGDVDDLFSGMEQRQGRARLVEGGTDSSAPYSLKRGGR